MYDNRRDYERVPVIRAGASRAPAGSMQRGERARLQTGDVPDALGEDGEDTTMAQTDTQSYLSAGYVITRAVRLPPERTGPLPAEVLSVSPDIAVFVPDYWAVEWASCSMEERREEAARFGITAAELQAVMTWVTAHFGTDEIGWTHVFYSLDLARTFLQTFLPHADDLVLLGIGVHPDIAPAFLEVNAPPPGEGRWGYYEMLARREGLAPGGEPLGFEVVGLGVGALHTWITNGWERITCSELGICPGRFGLLGEFDQAMQAADYRYPPGTFEEEASLWQPWLLVRYALAT